MLINDQIVMSEIIEDGVGCSFAEVAGQAQAKQALQECVILPSLRSQLSTKLILISNCHFGAD